MFWIGAAAGAFVVLVFIAAGIGIMGYQAANDNRKDKQAHRDGELMTKEQLYKFWQESNHIGREKVKVMEEILIALQRITP